MAFKTKYPNCRHNFGRTRPVARFKHIFLSTTNFGGHKKDLVVTAPGFSPVSAGLGRTVARKFSTGAFMFVQGSRHSDIVG